MNTVLLIAAAVILILPLLSLLLSMVLLGASPCTQLTKDTPRIFDVSAADVWNDLPQAAEASYEGSAMSLNSSGYARQLNTADSYFLGFLEKKSDNSAGAAGDLKVRIRSRGFVRIAVTGVSAVTDNAGTAVYASDGNVFTTASTGNLQIGKVHRWVTSTTAVVYFEASTLRSI